MKLSGLDLSPPASAAYSWITLGKYFSHCLSLPISKMEIVKYLLHGVVVRIKGYDFYKAFDIVSVQSMLIAMIITAERYCHYNLWNTTHFYL